MTTTTTPTLTTQLETERNITAILTRVLGERDAEIAALRKALAAVILACDGKCHCKVVSEIREGALKAVEYQNTGAINER